jgi:hypothetical protein
MQVYLEKLQLPYEDRLAVIATTLKTFAEEAYAVETPRTISEDFVEAAERLFVNEDARTPEGDYRRMVNHWHSPLFTSDQPNHRQRRAMRTAHLRWFGKQLHQAYQAREKLLRPTAHKMDKVQRRPVARKVAA